MICVLQCVPPVVFADDRLCDRDIAADERIQRVTQHSLRDVGMRGMSISGLTGKFLVTGRD